MRESNLLSVSSRGLRAALCPHAVTPRQPAPRGRCGQRSAGIDAGGGANPASPTSTFLRPPLPTSTDTRTFSTDTHRAHEQNGMPVGYRRYRRGAGAVSGGVRGFKSPSDAAKQDRGFKSPSDAASTSASRGNQPSRTEESNCKIVFGRVRARAAAPRSGGPDVRPSQPSFSTPSPTSTDAHHAQPTPDHPPEKMNGACYAPETQGSEGSACRRRGGRASPADHVVERAVLCGRRFTAEDAESAEGTERGDGTGRHVSAGLGMRSARRGATRDADAVGGGGSRNIKAPRSTTPRKRPACSMPCARRSPSHIWR